jgi:hypothetical protein
MLLHVNRIWKRIVIVLVALAMPYLGLTIWSFVALQNACATLRRDGRPMTLAEIQPRPLTEADNAAPLYRQAYQVLSTARIMRVSSSGQVPQGSAATDILAARLVWEMDQLAGTNATRLTTAGLREALTNPAAIQALALVEEGDRRKGCWIPLDWSKPANDQYPTYATHILVRLVCWRARLRSMDGESDDAWSQLLQTTNLVTSSAATPGVYACRLNLAKASIVHSTFRRLCQMAPPPTNLLLQATSQCKELEHPDAYLLAWDGDRIYYNEAFFGENRYRVFQPCGFFEKAYLSYWNPVLRLDQAVYLNAMRELVNSPCSTNELAIPFYCRVTHILDCGRYLYRENLRFLASLRCTRAGLAILLYRAQHGQWPDRLAQAIQPVPVDPFAEGQPLGYVQTTNGFVVSSVGRTPKSGQTIAWEFALQQP